MHRLTHVRERELAAPPYIREWTKAPGSESVARICPRKSPPIRGLWESYFLQGMIGKTRTQNLQILREDTLRATCSAGPFCLLPIYEQRRVDLATFRAVPASSWGHCSQVLFFTIVWDTPRKEKVAKWSSDPASILQAFNWISRPSKWTRRVWVANCCWPPRRPLENPMKSKLWVLWQHITKC